MKANELRLGNYIEREGTIVNLNLRVLDSILFDSLHKFKPIPLTEDWLLKFGFEKHPNNKLRLKLNGVFDECDWIQWQGGVFFEFGYYGCKEIPFLHQLQNLYFALTGQELSIKENTTVNG